MWPNPAVDPVRFDLWTLLDEAAQRRVFMSDVPERPLFVSGYFRFGSIAADQFST